MKGYQITFFTVQDRRHGHKQIGDWLLDLAKSMQLQGATLIGAQTGVGGRHRLHSAHFLELADQPLEVTMIVSEEESVRLFERLNAEPNLELFYAKTPVEFGSIGRAEQ
ncbi:DUF190 domain-containing protein [Allopusillimonas ginsengisoli]|uniref:DUF190 domain-containing protein n=1 Tax=Allopusillimonas ginsengisoli TaxID=453575 RepID=UPI0010C21757|nr:DUF190 domain-containing protein [Allopusillimonas ginsengisoli]